MEKKIKQTLLGDIVLISIFILLIWGTLLFSLDEIYRMSIDTTVFTIVAVACALCLIFLTCALLGVISHLKKNKEGLYTQEFSHLLKYQNINNEGTDEYEKQ